MGSLPIIELVSVTEAAVRRSGDIRFVDGIHISDRARAGPILL